MLSVEQLAERIAEIEQRIEGPKDPTRELDYSDQALATVAARMYNARRRRGRYFEPEMFSDPAWDMLLDLFVAQVRGKEMRTSSLSMAGGIPSTTGLRWINILEKHGLVERQKACGDRRLTLIAMTTRGYRLMRDYLIDGVGRNELPAGGGFRCP